MSGKLERGLVQVYTGNGKGKTTASLGLALRASGRGLRVHVLHFMKEGDYGELRAARRLAPELSVEQAGRSSFVSKRNPAELDRELARKGFDHARRLVASGGYDLVVLDELNGAVDFGLIPVAEVLELIRTKPAHTELVITGRNARPEVIEAADLVTEMREIKHYFRAGVPAREGIES